MLVVGAFFLPATALAGGDAPPEETQESGSLPTPMPTPEPPSSPWADAPTDNPFTPDGSATVVDNATSDDGKEFFTFATPEGNVFFLVIDRSRSNNNVYFLNAVTEQDLMALAEVSAQPPTFAPIPEPLPLPELEDEAEIPEPPAEIETQSNNNGTAIFIGLAVLAFGGAAYYLKIVRPKKQGAAFDDEEDEYEEEEDFDDEELEYEFAEEDEEYDEEEERLFDEIQ